MELHDRPSPIVTHAKPDRLVLSRRLMLVESSPGYAGGERHWPVTAGRARAPRSARRPRCLLRWSLFRRMWTDPCLRRGTGPPASGVGAPPARGLGRDRGRGWHTPLLRRPCLDAASLSRLGRANCGGRPSVRLLLLSRLSTGRDPPRCEPRPTYSKMASVFASSVGHAAGSSRGAS